MTIRTTAEVAEELRCSVTFITDLATKHGIGANFGGSAGFRFRDADVDALWEVMRPKVEAPTRRRRRSA